jgi:DNA-binding PadR family transcriptional regulator
MYEFIILSQLMLGPRHGYLIAKIINDIIGPYARLSPGRLYPLLAKMQQNGLIEANETSEKRAQGDHQSRAYKITEAGWQRFYVLMRDTSSSPGEYHKLFAYKVSAFGFIAPIERVALIDHYIHYCQAHVFHQQSEEDDLVRNGHGYTESDPSKLGFTLEVLRHSIDGWQHELDWAKSLRIQEFAQIEPTEQANNQESTLQEKPL